MNAFLVCVTRWMLATFWLFGALQQSESAIVCQVKPDNPKIVVLGVNSNAVSLNWKNCGANAGETIISFAFTRQRPGSLQVDQIASRGSSEGGFTMIAPFQDKTKYDALANQELRIYNVQRNDEYVYTLTITYRTSGGAFLEVSFRVTVDVKVPPKITTAPIREVQLSLSSSSVQNHTLKCNASGDPHPKITWTKAGIPASQFNASGYLLHLVNVQEKDAGSYICTASNGFGDNVTAIGIVNIRCTDCKTERVGIRIRDLTYEDPFGNEQSTEFEGLESPLLSAIWGAYADNPGKQLHRVDVVEFRDGSVYAIVELAFGPSVNDPLKPLRDEMNDGKLGSYTVDRQLDVNPTIEPTTLSPSTTTKSAGTRPETAAGTRPETDANWRKQRQILHVIYSTVICLLVVVVIGLVILLWRGRYNKGPGSITGFGYQRKYNQNSQITDHVTAAYTNTSPNLIIRDEASATLQSRRPGDLPSGENQSNQVNSDQEYMPLNPATKLRNWEISREYVQVSKVIGTGTFSQVAKALAWNINGIKGLTTVAVKMLKENAPSSDRKDLLSELDLMKKLKPHPHVIKLMGCITETEPLLVLIEYIPYGDLLGYLRKSRGLNDTYFKDPDVKPQTNLTSQQLMRFVWQIADGMSYLSSIKIIHRDLAARNVLVGEGEKCKVTDFGMARNVHRDDIYTRQSRGRLPVKWTAYEGLLYGTYTTQSDVWSFGVVLYEIFTVGGSPYPGINGREIANKLQQGYRMPKPQHVDHQLYQIMLQCWQENPDDRPTFSMLKDTITKMTQNSNHTYVNMKEYDTSLYSNVDDLVI